MALAAGTVLGQYEIRLPVGAGGMGEVYRAYDSRLGREVAIKVLPESLTSDPERLRRFEQEARAAAALNHPNILAVYQMATHEGVSYMVTELLEGETLRDRLRHGPIPLRKVIDYAVQIAHGLAAAHDKSITHRDLKPENLFVTKDGRVKVLDFGLAKVGPSKDDSGLEATQATGTESGLVMGTVGYMSPEQVRGKTADHRSDIFSFGTILYEMVTGKQTFRKPTSAETMTAILKEEPPSISLVAPTSPPGLQRVVRRCLEKSPEQRFQSASDLAFALEALSDSESTTPSAGHAHIGERASRRGIAIAGAALVVLLCIGVMAYFWMRPEPVPKVSNFVQLTHDGEPKGLVGTDGSRILLYLGTHDYRSMAEMSAAGGEPKRIPILPSASMSPLGLSPDGSQLLVEDGRGVPLNGPLWSVPVLGGSPRKLGDTTGQGGSWSANGRMLAYSDGNDVYVAKADGTEARKLVTVGDSGFVFAPVWSPNGNHLRFTYVAKVDDPDYYMEVSLDGTGLHRLLPDWSKPDDTQGFAQWTADGRYFVFAARNQIWALPRKTGFLRSEVKPIQLTSSPIPLTQPIPSKDGTKLYVVGTSIRGELLRYDAKSKEFAPFLGGISAEFVDFSKDGEWVTYVSYPEGTLWRSKVDGSGRLQLTYPPLYALVPRWSPDGKEIVFFETVTGRPDRIYAVSREGGTPRVLLPDDHSLQHDPHWSPDGTKLVFGGASRDPASDIRIFDLATHQISTVPGSQGLYSPRWSPNGSSLAALSFDSKRLLLFDFQTQKWVEIASSAQLGFPTWSKDGRSLYFLEQIEPRAVVRIRISDHKLERLLELKNISLAGHWGHSMTLTPDDSPVLLRNAGTQDVYALDWEEP